jgi:hypothetical protein
MQAISGQPPRNENPRRMQLWFPFLDPTRTTTLPRIPKRARAFHRPVPKGPKSLAAVFSPTPDPADPNRQSRAKQRRRQTRTTPPERRGAAPGGRHGKPGTVARQHRIVPGEAASSREGLGQALAWDRSPSGSATNGHEPTLLLRAPLVRREGKAGRFWAVRQRLWRLAHCRPLSTRRGPRLFPACTCLGFSGSGFQLPTTLLFPSS